MVFRLTLRLQLLVLVLLVGCASAWATHNRAGEITYRHVNGLTYEVTITTCTKSTVIADRQWLQINWGDIPAGGQLDSLERLEDQIINMPDIESQINTYVGTHTYNGAGTYTLTVIDPNRNQGVLNIPNSVDVPFCIRSELIISPVTGHNNSVQLLNLPKEQACLNQFWIHNPGAYDPDGDRLEYSLVECRGFECAVIPGYQYPDDSTADVTDVFAVDPVTGDVTWEVPPEAGEFNIAILIEEFRLTPVGYVKVGSVVRDMQINVIICDNNPPEIEDIADICVRIFDPVNIGVDASDPDGNNITLTAVGGPLSEVENPASFNPFSGEFTWFPECTEVRLEPYQVHFKALDNSSTVDLTDIETVLIQVVATPVENGLAEPSGPLMQVTWDAHACLSAYDEADWDNFEYHVYRRAGQSAWAPEYCETGIPAEAGYAHVGTVEGLDQTAFTDQLGELFSGFYCYRIVVVFPDGSQSVASEEFCAELRLDNPLVTRTSVAVTDPVNGEVEVEWFTPIEVDTLVFLPPYQYKVYHSSGFTDAVDLIYESSLGAILFFDDLSYLHTGIDTQSNGHTYKVEFYSDGNLVSTSLNATSIFLSIQPSDNALTLSANFQHPWSNTLYDWYRWNPDLPAFELIGSTADPVFVDEGLLNNVEYCYQIRAEGTYSADGLPEPLINFSQESCGTPFDLTPPCAPQLEGLADCDAEQTYLDWASPYALCGSDDVTAYNIYYAVTDTSDFELLTTLELPPDTSYIFNEFQDLGTIAGCFYVTALDSLLPGPSGELTQNESPPSNTVCTDNCPEYSLPNVFTPNDDQANDLLIPFPYRFVDSIDLSILNRWGTVVFQTTDPEILWDGSSMTSGEKLTDGTYYYIITVSTIRLSGIVEESVSGYITILNNTPGTGE